MIHIWAKNVTSTRYAIILGWDHLHKLIFVLYLLIINILIMTPEAERFNGWAAMLGFVAAVGAYVTTGQIIPGWF